MGHPWVDTIGAGANLEKQAVRAVGNYVSVLPRALPSSPWLKFSVFTSCGWRGQVEP